MKPWELLCKIWQLLGGIIEEAAPELEQLGLYPRAFFLLSKVTEFPYPAQLAQALLLPAPTVTFIVKQMEKLGFIKRDFVREDLRRYHLTLTDNGKVVLAKGKEAVDRSMKKRMEQLSKSELKHLVELLSSMEARPDA